MLQYAEPILSAFLSQFQAGHADSTEDTELRKALFSQLYRHFLTLGIKFKMPRKALEIGYYPEKEFVEMNPVRTDYPTKEKFDIVILKTEEPVTVETVRATGKEKSPEYQAFWKQRLALAVRLRYCSADQDFEKFLKQIEKDEKQFDRFRDENGADSLESSISILLTDSETQIPQEYLTRLEKRQFEIYPGNSGWVISSGGTFLLT